MTAIAIPPVPTPLIPKTGPTPDAHLAGVEFMAVLLPEISISPAFFESAQMSLALVDETELDLIVDGATENIQQAFTAELSVAAPLVPPGIILDIPAVRRVLHTGDGGGASGEVAPERGRTDALTASSPVIDTPTALRFHHVDDPLARTGKGSQPAPDLAVPPAASRLPQQPAGLAQHVPAIGAGTVPESVVMRAFVAQSRVENAAMPEKHDAAETTPKRPAMSAVQALPTIPAQRPLLPESTVRLPSASGPARTEILTVATTHAIPLSGPIAAPKGLPIPPPRVAEENPTPVAMPPLTEQRVAPTNAAIPAANQLPEQTTSVSDNPIHIRASAYPSMPHLAVVRLPSQTAAERAFLTRVSLDVLHTPMPKIEAVPAIQPQIAEVEKTIPAELVPPPDADSTAPSAAPVIPPAILSPETDLRAPNAIEAGLRLQQPMMGGVPDVSLQSDVVRLPSPIPLTDLPQAIVKIVQSEPANSVELRLDPVELGSVRLTLQGTERDISVVIAVERPDTMELLRKHADQLLNDLRQSGYAGASLTFNMSEQHNPARRETDASPSPDFDLQQQPQSQPLTRPEVRGHSGGLDMRL